MSDYPFVLIDLERRKLFNLIGVAVLKPSARAVPWSDASGIPWLGESIGGLGLAVTWLGPGWVFDPYAGTRRKTLLDELKQAVRGAARSRHLTELREAWTRVPHGRRAARLLWAVQQAVVRTGRSVVRIPDRVLGTAVWGRDRSAWPKHWRGDLRRLLEGLTWLHVADWPAGDPAPPFGRDSVLLTHVADLRGCASEDDCEADCPYRHGASHSHFLVNVGRGFLGVLETRADPDQTGVRTYPVPGAGGHRALRTLGKTGRLLSAYLPAALGEPAACNGFSPVQHRLLQTLVRETTRAGKAEPGTFARLSGNVLPAIGKGQPRACPLLEARAGYVGFNGNGKRKGLGYRLLTPGGWLAKAGYPPQAAADFLADLAALAGPLRLTVVGSRAREDGFADLPQLRSLAACPVDYHRLEKAHLRVFGPENYVDVWNGVFG